MKLLNLLPPENYFIERLFALQKAIAIIETPNVAVLNQDTIIKDSYLN